MPGELDEAREALRGLRIGCVRYLNARPLVAPYDGPVMLDHPSVLAGALVRGELDAALVPVFEALRTPGFLAVDGIGIAADGPVWSVFVAHQGPLDAIRRLALDPASLTSAHLCRILFAERRGGVEAGPQIVAEGEPADARLLIGNQAIEFRRREGDRYEYLDFGTAWKELTGLPFVFAVWLLRADLPEPGRYAEAFRAVARRGEALREQYALEAGEDEATRVFARRYLNEWIRYRVGTREKAAMAEYGRLLLKHRLLPEGCKAAVPPWV